ncbi:PP2C family protein-serine/threonine phosphatase [Actinoallomurus rhizosphaericola]|uniref:PP2C family protein-serine/threonine phosphatase n=1 Tax=Actinoallomurus rhizosphaericola TaxID=2952536 RepID=UPI0020921B77|nr:SpoIIE family protein phosphatase [Actinoallomurus rhizosphaericola]MCO6000108.1 SpoIIE family protein phosphatase [Actinoallomurus rhizosphaericola]
MTNHGLIALDRQDGAEREARAISGIDYAALFAATPTPNVVLDPDLVIVEVNQAYLDATGRTREDLLGQYIFDAFPDNPADPEAEGVQNLSASLHRVLNSRQPDVMPLQKYDIPIMNRPGQFEERWWSTINTPILAADGHVTQIINRVEDVTAFVQSRVAGDHLLSERITERDALEAELYERARELQRLNEELRQAHARERQVAVTLQEAMLQSPDLAQHPDVAVRYLPATESLNVCGDWHDLIDLSDDCFSVAVGDVVGHGLDAAATMGMLRSALNAAVRATQRPAQALESLGLYSRSFEGALNTTAVAALVNRRSQVIVYSSAGHPPMLLVHPDGSCDLLDQATDPPLGARPQHVPRPQASHSYSPGDTLVLYTDGLIERRGEDIDAGLARLTGVLGRHRTLDPEPLADALLTHLGAIHGTRDDIAIVIVRL